MWNRNTKNLCELLKIQMPIIQAPMAGGPTTPQLVSTVSNLGALGSLGAGYLPIDKLQEEIQSIKSQTDQSYSVNIFIPPQQDPSYAISESAKSKLMEIQKKLGAEEIQWEPEFIFFRR